MFADEVLQAKNREVIYTDLYVQLYFNMDNLPSQKIFNEEALEVSPLDTPANYRTKFQVNAYLNHFHQIKSNDGSWSITYTTYIEGI